MRLAPRLRFEIARRPWIRWLVVVTIAVGVGQITRTKLEDLDHSRTQWGESRVVMVADVAHVPGDRVQAHRKELPLAALPDGALDALPPGATTKRHLVADEIVGADDLTDITGPASTADPGTGVVALGLSDTAPEVGVPVQVVAEGVVLADSATVVANIDGTIYVAVPIETAPIVAAAAHSNTATLVYLP